jgi:general secretion pathway protein D
MSVRLPNHSLFLVLLFAGGLGFVACSASSSAYKKGNAAGQQGNWDAALVHYTRAVTEAPQNIEYRIALERALIESSSYHVQQGQKHLAAENLLSAVDELDLAVDLDPTNKYAQSILDDTRERLAEREAQRDDAEQFEDLRRRARELFGGRPILEPSSTAPIQLRFAEDTSLQKIFEVLSKLSGINVLFDESFRDKRVTVDLVDVSFEEALDKLVLINRLFYKVVDTSTIIIIPDNAQKHRQYDELVLRTFYLVNAEVNTIVNMFRTIAGIQRVQPNPELKSITVRATPDQVAVAERIVDLNDKTKSEIILDVEILEINRNRMMEYGLQLAEYQVGLGFSPAGAVDVGDDDSSTVNPNVALRLNRLTSVDSSDFVLSFPSSAAFRLFKSKSEARLLASPKLRASEGHPAELRLGQEVPIPVTSFVSQFGTGGIPATPVTSFQYRNIGINVNITPRVFVDGVIELKLQLETSQQLDTRIIGGIELPVFGTRTVNNVVRLQDGETNLIGGLISEETRRSVSGFPGITDLPLLRRIFASNDDEASSTDVVFSVTPHIVRAPRVTELDLAPLPMGTEQRIKVSGIRPRIFDAVRDVALIEKEPPEPPKEDAAATTPSLPLDPEALPSGAGPTTDAVPRPPGPVSEVSVLFSPPLATLSVGDTLDVVLVGGYAQGLSAGEITLTYDAEALRVSDVQQGAFLTIDGRPVRFTASFNPGQLRIEFERQDDTIGLRGSGHWARLTIEALTPGPTRVMSASGSLRDASGANLPASFASMRIEVQ